MGFLPVQEGERHPVLWPPPQVVAGSASQGQREGPGLLRSNSRQTVRSHRGLIRQVPWTNGSGSRLACGAPIVSGSGTLQRRTHAFVDRVDNTGGTRNGRQICESTLPVDVAAKEDPAFRLACTENGKTTGGGVDDAIPRLRHGMDQRALQ